MANQNTDNIVRATPLHHSQHSHSHTPHTATTAVTAASTALLAVWRVLALGACLNHRPAGQVIFKLDAESGALTKQGDPITIEGKPRCVKFGVLPTS